MGKDDYMKPFGKSSDIKECTPESFKGKLDRSEPIEDGDCVCNLTTGDGDGDKIPACYRYAAYGNRIRTAINASVKSASRYLAYTSDVGESFRPVFHDLWSVLDMPSPGPTSLRMCRITRGRQN
uniref:Dimethylglycine N-methyltransferase n=1 Tax=Lygus hesperus TaxID=30085 RepID=A0A0A9WLX4_LYGHE